MNERFKELEKQATTVVEGWSDERGTTRYYEFNREKFAELIVKECYEHCKGQMLDKEVADTNELTYNDAVMDCSNGLLQHFGLEQ